jgi:hypothetical protein
MRGIVVSSSSSAADVRLPLHSQHLPGALGHHFFQVLVVGLQGFEQGFPFGLKIPQRQGLANHDLQVIVVPWLEDVSVNAAVVDGVQNEPEIRMSRQDHPDRVG